MDCLLHQKFAFSLDFSNFHLGNIRKWWPPYQGGRLAELQSNLTRGFLDVDEDLKAVREIILRSSRKWKDPTSLPSLPSSELHDITSKTCIRESDPLKTLMKERPVSVDELSPLPPACDWCRKRKPIQYDLFCDIGNEEIQQGRSMDWNSNFASIESVSSLDKFKIVQQLKSEPVVSENALNSKIDSAKFKCVPKGTDNEYHGNFSNTVKSKKTATNVESGLSCTPNVKLPTVVRDTGYQTDNVTHHCDRGQSSSRHSHVLQSKQPLSATLEHSGKRVQDSVGKIPDIPIVDDNDQTITDYGRTSSQTRSNSVAISPDLVEHRFDSNKELIRNDFRGGIKTEPHKFGSTVESTNVNGVESKPSTSGNGFSNEVCSVSKHGTSDAYLPSTKHEDISAGNKNNSIVQKYTKTLQRSRKSVMNKVLPTSGDSDQVYLNQNRKPLTCPQVDGLHLTTDESRKSLAVPTKKGTNLKQTENGAKLGNGRVAMNNMYTNIERPTSDKIRRSVIVPVERTRERPSETGKSLGKDRHSTVVPFANKDKEPPADTNCKSHSIPVEKRVDKNSRQVLDCDFVAQKVKPMSAEHNSIKGSNYGGATTDVNIQCCPLCQKNFDSSRWSQMDIDGHIALCLSAAGDDVMW